MESNLTTTLPQFSASLARRTGRGSGQIHFLFDTQKTIEMKFVFDQFGETVYLAKLFGRFDFPDDVSVICCDDSNELVASAARWLDSIDSIRGKETNWKIGRKGVPRTHKRASSTEPNTKDSAQSTRLRMTS